MIGNDPAGVRQDGVILRQGGHEVGIEGQSLQTGQKEPHDRQNDQYNERPP
jgi:hypothetical protein